MQNIDDTGIRNYNRDRNKRGRELFVKKKGNITWNYYSGSNCDYTDFGVYRISCIIRNYRELFQKSTGIFGKQSGIKN